MTLFLGTTALDQFWRKEEEILFLGSWCLRQDRPQAWRALRFRVMPSPWHDRSRFYEAASNLDQTFDRLLGWLAGYCNFVHGTNHGKRYWRVLLGPWLIHALHATYDRYVHLQEALRLGVSCTIGLAASSYRVPGTTAVHFDWLTGDHYNLQIYTQLLEGLGIDMDRAAADPPGKPAARSAAGPRLLIRQFLDTALPYVEHAFRRHARVALYDPYVSRLAAWQLAIRSGLTVLPVHNIPIADPPAPRFDSRRSGLVQIEGRSEFERLFAQLLPHQFPTLFLEGFEALSRATARVPAVDVVASAAGWHFNETFKMAAARSSERGARLVALQHGGGYGMYRSAPLELAERRVSDRFMAWGWAGQDRAGLRNVPGPGLSRVARRRMTAGDLRRNRTILFVATAHPRYLYRFQSVPVGSQWEEYFEWQQRFLSALGEETRREVSYRSLPVDFGQAVTERMSASFPDLKWDKMTTPAVKRLARCRIVVIDHCATTLLEALAANIPTILYWHPDRWEARTEAASYTDALRRAKILFDRPEEAASHLERQYADPGAWWREPLVQNARDAFVGGFALCRRDWQRIWIDALTDEANRTRPGQAVTDDLAN